MFVNFFVQTKLHTKVPQNFNFSLTSVSKDLAVQKFHNLLELFISDTKFQLKCAVKQSSKSSGKKYKEKYLFCLLEAPCDLTSFPSSNFLA